MKSFIQYLLESASIGKGSPWALAKGSVGKKSKAPTTPTTPNAKVKPSSVYDIGHYNKPKGMKQVDLHHMGARSGYGSINHHTHWKESNIRRAKSGWEGKVTPNNANHGTWKKTHSDEHFAQGRIDHILKKYTVNGSNDKMEERARNHISKNYPEYSEYHISN